jgi:predicted PurR-regulated permease PerM
MPAFMEHTKTDRITRISYLFMVGLFVAVAALHLATPLLAALFSYLALSRLVLFKRGGRWVAVALFLVLLSAAAYSLGWFINNTIQALPDIADNSIPPLIAWAKEYGISLPFTDYDSLKDLGVDTLKSQAKYLGSFAKVAKGATTNLLFMIAGCVVAISLFLNSRFDLTERGEQPNDLYSQTCGAISRRFGILYQSFVTVMGAQIIISAINTVLTTIFGLAVGLRHVSLIAGVTFICGMLPVVGNLISNSVVVVIAFTISPRVALVALIFLVVIHKLEYFLNSKIVGWRIRNPLWLTLLGLIIGEKLMGVPGMILAPVFLHYVKVEASGTRPCEEAPAPTELLPKAGARS